MYFKTATNSKTGQKLYKIKLLMSACHDAANALSIKYKFNKWRMSSSFIGFGGISSCASFDTPPNLKHWKKIRSGEYMPKLSTKIGKAIQEEIDNLPYISKDTLNESVGFNNDFMSSIGVNLKRDDYYGFSIPKDCNYNPPDDCIEITVSEYKKLFT